MRRPALALACLATSGCFLFHSYTQRPEVKLLKVELGQVDFQGATLNVQLEVKNKVPAGITVGKVTWSVAVDGSRLASGELANGVTIPSNGSVAVIVPVTVKFSDLYKVAEKYQDQDTAPYHLEGTVALDTPVGPVTIPFHHDDHFPVLKIPQVELAKVDVKSMSFSGASIRLGFRVQNPNVQSLTLDKLDYAVTLGGSKVAEGGLEAPLELPAKGSGGFDADVKLSLAQAAQAAQSVGRSNTDYLITGAISARTPFGPVSTTYSRAGTVKIQR